ncbi:cell division ATP-binding protein FtsE [bacterium]|nr:cell division ATP-binding protein FtsE [bacterium]
MIIFKNVNLKYPTGIIGLDNVSLRIGRGDFVFIVGSTGGGKSTLLKVIYAEEKIDSGSILVLRGDISDVPSRLVPMVRRSIGVVFQNFELLSNRTIEENVAFTLDVIGAPKYEIERKVPAALKLVGLDGKEKNYPDELSGGEQQRVSIARAIINNPPILLADEPTGNLDPGTSVGIVKLLMKINEKGTTVLMATHDKNIVDMFQKRVVQIEDGQILSDISSGGYQDAIQRGQVFPKRNTAQH